MTITQVVMTTDEANEFVLSTYTLQYATTISGMGVTQRNDLRQPHSDFTGPDGPGTYCFLAYIVSTFAISHEAVYIPR